MRYTLIDRIAYRGDTRSPSEIFRIGFWNKQNPEFLWQQIAFGTGDPFNFNFSVKLVKGSLSMKELRPYAENVDKLFAIQPLQPNSQEYRLYLKSDPSKYVIIKINKPGGTVFKNLYMHYSTNVPQYRDEEYWKKKEPGTYGKLVGEALKVKLMEDRRVLEDINPESAVCLTLKPDCAPFFPVEGSDVHGEWVWIYAMYTSAAVKTYSLQKLRGSNMTFAKEIAVEHVPGSYILCAVHCKRNGKYPVMRFNLDSRIIWNRNVLPEIRMRWARHVQLALMPYQGYVTLCPTPTTGTARLGRRLIFQSLF